jgi:hypothetical protein
MILLSDIRCACGSDAIMCVDPGEDSEESVICGTRFVTRAGRPVTGRCLQCLLVTEEPVV